MKDKRFKHVVFDLGEGNPDLVVSDYFKLSLKIANLPIMNSFCGSNYSII